MSKTRNYLCEDNESGEQFIVEAGNREECQHIFEAYGFEDPHIICTISDLEAECCGLDTY